MFVIVILTCSSVMLCRRTWSTSSISGTWHTHRTTQYSRFACVLNNLCLNVTMVPICYGRIFVCVCVCVCVCALPALVVPLLYSSAEYLGWQMMLCSSLSDCQPALQTTWTPASSAAAEADAYSSPDTRRRKCSYTVSLSRSLPLQNNYTER